MSKLIIFSAPSGSGKSTIVRYLLEQGLPFRFSISATSRAPRGEGQKRSGVLFSHSRRVQKRIANDEFLEYEEVYTDKFYGTLKSEVERILAEGNHVIFDVDCVGGLHIKICGARALSISSCLHL